MRVRSIFFASYRDLAGTEELALELPPGSRVADLLARLRRDGGGLRQLPPVPVVAVNMEYAPLSAPLAEGDEVAWIPPVSGG